MSVGEHSVLLYPDPNAGGWASAGVYNESFDIAAGDGWIPAPFTPALNTSVPGEVSQTQTASDTALAITQTAVRVPARVTTGLYRMTLGIKLNAPCTWFYGVNFGDTQDNARLGPFWAGDTHAVFLWGARSFLTAGTYTVDITINPTDVNPAFGYVTPAVNFLRTSATGGTLVKATFQLMRLEYLAGEGVDVSCLVDEVAIQHGRDDAATQPVASTATLGLDLRDAALPGLADIGSIVSVQSTLNGGASTRFFGRITDVAMGWDDAGAETPNETQGQMVATGLMADLGRRVVGDEPWPQELDGARVARILDLAGLDPNPATSDPGTVNVNPRDVDARAALELAHETATSAGGIVWQTRASDVRYADAAHRRGAQPTLVLDACDILVTPTWSRTLEGLVNKVTVAYGVAPEGGEQPTVKDSNAASMTRYGVYDYSVTTQLAELADAQAMVGVILARNSKPVWVMTALPVDVKGLSDDDTQTLLGLEMHDLLTVTGLPVITPSAPTTAHLWVEGWRERLAWGVHELELSVSGYCRTAPVPRWDDVQPDWTWDAMAASWDDAACFGPPVTDDRWTDVPASLRWDAMSTTSWDTYAGGLRTYGYYS